MHALFWKSHFQFFNLSKVVWLLPKEYVPLQNKYESFAFIVQLDIMILEVTEYQQYVSYPVAFLPVRYPNAYETPASPVSDNLGPANLPLSPLVVRLSPVSLQQACTPPVSSEPACLLPVCPEPTWPRPAST